jgi:anti-sigma28 factor (negative regulator of flagellin synthesis)
VLVPGLAKIVEWSRFHVDKPFESDRTMNMKVTDSNPIALEGVRPGSAAAKPAQTEPTAKPGVQSEVSLSPASQSVYGSRSEKVAALKQAVDSGSYKPSSQLTSEKLVSGALSRPE